MYRMAMYVGRRAALLSIIATVLSFAARADDPVTTPPAREITMIAVGDIMLGGTATPELARFGYDYPFEKIRSLLRKADVAFGNLEGPLTTRGEAQRKRYTFRSPPAEVAPALARAGFDVMSLANNHSMDYGIEGLRDTIMALKGVGIRHAGAGEDLAGAREPAVLERGDTRVAVLAYSLTFPEEFWAKDHEPGTAFGHEDQVRADVARARARADVVIVSFHWGQEGSTDLRDYQRTLGHAAVDAGAAAVLGHHPHVLQGVERYRDGVILYSLGNFVFGSYSREATTSVVAVLSFRDRRVRKVALHPINVNNAEVVFQPYLLSGSAANDVVERIVGMSRPLGATFENRNGVAVLDVSESK
jgi:poly-gamma-glutamate synthesis protein (capsule biosynthesis protein)